MWGEIFMLYTELYMKAVTLKYNLQLGPCFPCFILQFFGEQMKKNNSPTENLAQNSCDCFESFSPLEKNKAILYHADISKRYFSVCHLKIVFYFLHELKQRSRSSDVTGRH